MRIAEEIQWVKNQIHLNQSRYARCINEGNEAGMRYLEQCNRELIDRLHQLQSSNRSVNPYTANGLERGQQNA